jgi:uncharacterized protein (TIGR02271 family)
VETSQPSADYGEKGAYGAYYLGGDELVDLRPGERANVGEISGEGPGTGAVRERGGFGDEDELRVQRVEEELRAGTREREAGGVNVRKRVRTDRERVRVPKRREEVHVERVPVEEGRGTTGSEIGEDEIRVPVIEEEVVVEKRPVVREEIQLRKEVVEEDEVVEADLRKEEVAVEDQIRRLNT